MDVTALLRASPHFASLSDGDLAAIVGAFDVRDHPDGHVFIREGDSGGSVFIVADGQVVVTGTSGGVPHELGRLGPGSLFGLVALVDSERRSAGCHAAGPCKVGVMPASAASLLFRQRAPIACAFQRALAVQLAKDFRHLDARLRSIPPS